jgi:DNA-binding NarL/FixJ family response regulator
VRSGKVRIFLVDDHPLVREWLANLIHQQPDLIVCGEAENAAHAAQQFDACQPDLAIVDISLPGASGIELIRQLRTLKPGLQIIVLSMHDEKVYGERAVRAGASGYVTKRDTAQRIIGSIRRVLEGKLGVSDELAASLVSKYVDGKPLPGANPIERLSDREIEIFRLLGQGLDTRNVAGRLNISIKTVQAYCARIKEKLALSNATELLREAIRWNETNVG